MSTRHFQVYSNYLQVTFPTIYFTLFNFQNLRKFWYWTRVSTKDWKYLLLKSRVYARPQFSILNSYNKFLVRFKGRNAQVSAGFNIFPKRFQKRKPSENLGWKLKVILESIQFKQLRVSLDCLNCLFSVFLRSFVISFSWERDKVKINIVIDILPLVPYLAKLCFQSYGPICCWPVKLEDSSKSQGRSK